MSNNRLHDCYMPLLVIVLGMMVDSDLAVELAPLDYAEIASRNSLVKNIK